jgi:hypothetical protein
MIAAKDRSDVVKKVVMPVSVVLGLGLLSAGPALSRESRGQSLSQAANDSTTALIAYKI